MAEKQLIVVVEGTAALGPHWQTIFSEYLEKVIRCFCGNEANGQKLLGAELALVVFNTHGPYSALLVQRSGWTKDIDVFFQWLLGIPFGGGVFGEVAIAEGLAEALMMFPLTSNGIQNLNTKKHCILISASNPYPLPFPVYCPRITSTDQGEKTETHNEICLADAETVAKSFGQRFVSLSAISPKQLPKLRAIFSAGQRNPQAIDSAVGNTKNFQYLVLLSENFTEARAALSQTVNQGIAKLEGSPEPTQMGTSFMPSVNGAANNRQPIGNIPIATVKLEPTTVPSMVPGSAYSQIPSISNVASQSIPPSLQTSSLTPTSLEMTPKTESKPLVSNLPQSVRPVGSANISILNYISKQQHTMMNSASIAVGAIGFQNLGSFASASSNVTGNSNIGISSAMGTIQGNIGGLGQSVSNGGQFDQGGIVMNQNIINNGGPTNMSSGPGPMMTALGISQHGGINSMSMNNNTSNMPMLVNASGVQLPHASYTKIWEGALSGQKQGQPVSICKLEGYRSVNSPESFAADWPPTMQIVRLITQDHMNNKQYVGKSDFLVFRPLNQHGFLDQLQEKKICAVIQLPSQTLLLSVAEKVGPPGRLLGMLLPGDMVVFKPQIPGQPQLQQTQQGGINSMGMNNNTSNRPMLANASGIQLPRASYTKIWEGALSGQKQGQPVSICELEGYKSVNSPESLAADWPSTMLIVRLIAQDHMNNKQYVGKADFLVFRPLNQHGFLDQLQEKKLCAVIQLPSQTLLLSVAEKAGRLLGMLFPGDMVVFKPQVPGQAQLQQTQQQLQLQLQ